MSGLSKNAAIYLFSNIAVAAVPFALLPVLTRYLGPDGYGVVALYTTFLPLLGAVIGLSVHGAISRRWFDKDEIDMPQYVSGCVFILLISGFVVFFSFLFLDEWISSKISIPIFWLYMAIVVSVLSFIIQIRLVLWQVQGMAKKYGAMQFSAALLNGVFSIFLVVLYLKGVEGRLWGHFVPFVLFGILALFLLYREGLLKFKTQLSYIKDALLFGVPLIPHVIGAFLLLMADRVIVNDHLGPRFVGIYMVAVQISLGLQIINDAFGKAFSPWLFERLKSGCDVEKARIVRITYIYFFCLLLTVPISAFLARFVIDILAGPEYAEAAEVLPFLVLAQSFHGMYYLVTGYLFYERKTHITASVTIVCGAAGVLVTWWLVGKYGLIGAGIGASVAMFFQFILTWFMAAKVHPMPWGLVKNKIKIE